MNQERRGNGEKHRINYRIKCPQVRVVDETGAVLGIMPTYKAQDLAKEKGLDLVEVSPTANPPVCKIMDYGKLKYEEKKAKSHQRQQKTKEILLRPVTDDHDFAFKLRHVIEFLKEGDKVQIRVKFKGRAIIHPEEGRKRILEITANEDVRAISRIEFGPTMEGRDMILTLAPASQKGARPQTPQGQTVTGRTPTQPEIQRLPPRTDVGKSLANSTGWSSTSSGRVDCSRPNMSNLPKPEFSATPTVLPSQPGRLVGSPQVQSIPKDQSK